MRLRLAPVSVSSPAMRCGRSQHGQERAPHFRSPRQAGLDGSLEPARVAGEEMRVQVHQPAAMAPRRLRQHLVDAAVVRARESGFHPEEIAPVRSLLFWVP